MTQLERIMRARRKQQEFLLAVAKLDEAAAGAAASIVAASEVFYRVYVESGASLDGYEPSPVPDTLREMME